MSPISEPHANKELFLDRIRRALGRDEPLEHTPDYPALKNSLPRQQEKVRTINAKVEARRDTLVAKLAETATAGSWHVHMVQSNDDAAAVVAEVAVTAGAKHIIRSAEEIFRKVNIDRALRSRGLAPTVLASGRSRKRSDLPSLAFRSDMGVTGVSYAIAETASCAVIQRKGVARLASLAPAVLALIVESSQVLESLDDFFAITRLSAMQPRGRIAPYFNFISGPSRTADIEQTLTIGVHGPGEVHMVIVSES